MKLSITTVLPPGWDASTSSLLGYPWGILLGLPNKCNFLVPIYSPGWRKTMWSKGSCLRIQHNGRDQAWTTNFPIIRSQGEAPVTAILLAILNEWMNEWMHACMHAWVGDWMNEQMNERTNEWNVVIYIKQTVAVSLWLPVSFVIMQIVAEKQKFRKTPYNYAQKKNHLMRSKVCTNQNSGKMSSLAYEVGGGGGGRVVEPSRLLGDVDGVSNWRGAFKMTRDGLFRQIVKIQWNMSLGDRLRR